MASTRTTELPPDEVPDRAAAYGLLASAVVALVPHTLRYPLWLTALLALLFAWRFLMLRRGWPMPSRWLRYAMTVLAVVLVYRHHGTIFGRDAGSSLLAIMLALKFLELRRLRDYMLAVFLIYFIIAIGFLYSQDLWLVGYLVAVFVASTATLVRLALPGLSARRSLRLALVVLAQALPLLLLMHFMFPRLQGSLWGMPSDAYEGRTGLSEEMSPGSINSLALSDEIAFRAHFPTAVPPNAELYWRAVVLAKTDGKTWTRGPVRTRPAPPAPAGPVLSYSLTIEPSNKPWLPALGLPLRAPERARLLTDMTVEMRHPIRERLVAEIDSQLSMGGDDDRFAREAALRLPPLSARMQELARTLRKDRDPSQTVQAALGYFREQQFYYTLEPPLLGDDPADEFLFESRRGFCEHYAAAFTLLMRAGGIPARVVTGYQGGEFNGVGSYFVVRQSDAHAWSEVWLESRGWVRVDPTAAVAPERIEYGADGLRRLLARGARLGRLLPGALELSWMERLRRDVRQGLDVVQSGWQRWVLGYNASRQQELLKRLGLQDLDAVRLLGLLCLLVALIFAVYLAVTWPRRPRPDPALRAYRLFCRRLARVGIERAPQEGPLQFSERCSRQRPDLSAEVEDITRLYIRLRYGSGRADPDLLKLGRKISVFRPQPLA